MTARAAMARGLVALAARPGVLAAALLAGAGAGLGTRAGNAAFSRVARIAVGHWPRGLFMAFWGDLLAALLFTGALCVLLAALDGEREPDLLRAGLRRTPGILSLWAVEGLLYGTLLLAVLAPGARVIDSGRGVIASAVLATAAVALPFAVFLVAFPAFRVAVVETARGCPSHLALARGVAWSASRLPLLWKLGLAVLVFTAPLWGAALAIDHRAGGRPGLVVIAAALRGALTLLATAWGYSALVQMVDAGQGERPA